MASFKYYLDKPRKLTGECALYLRYKCVSGSTTFYPGYVVLATRWDAKAQRLKGTGLIAQRLNNELVSFRQLVQQAVRQLQALVGTGTDIVDPAPGLVKEHFLLYHTVSGQPRQLSNAVIAARSKIPATTAVAAGLLVRTLPELVEQVLVLRRNELRKGSADQYRNAARALLRYAPASDECWQLSKLSHLHLEAWRQWLILPKAEGGLGTDNQTANNRVSLVHAVLTYARGYHSQYRQLLSEELLGVCKRRFKVLKRVREHLTQAELLQFYHAPLPTSASGSEHLIRDVYCLSWLTSLRQSDLFGLGPQHISWDSTGTVPVTIDITSLKSSRASQMPLNELAAGIVLRWLNRTSSTLAPGTVLARELARFSWPSDRLFPQVSRGRHNIIKRVFQSLNLFLEPVELVRIKGANQVRTTVPRWQLLTLHTARHGFGNFMAVSNVPIEDAMLLMGHAYMESTNVYYHRPQQQAVDRARAALHWPVSTLVTEMEQLPEKDLP